MLCHGHKTVFIIIIIIIIIIINKLYSTQIKYRWQDGNRQRVSEDSTEGQ